MSTTRSSLSLSRSAAGCIVGREVPTDAGASGGHDVLVRELGRIHGELVTQRQLRAMTVHDLANPAQVILGLSELLLDNESLDPVVRRRLEQMHRSATTMSAMISDLSNGLALDDEATLDVERVNLVELVSSVVERARVLARAKNMKLQVLAEQLDAEGCWVDGDQVKLERALTNLIGNAIKFSPPGSRVSVALDRGVRDATVSVHDQGPGISPQGRERIFEVFQREAHTSHVPGQGLGLFITKQIVESHGGSITVDSVPGRGATFLLRVPLVGAQPLGEPV